jgi:uncharacterized protein YjbI with pentapeptide repeats
MANAAHLKLLQRGIHAWDAWRKEERSVHPNLSGADLSDTDLSWMNLSGVDLTGANLEGANLESANLSKANLSEARLVGAWLYCTKLRSADLSGAILTEASLINADLRRANFAGAWLDGTMLARANLSNANLIGSYLEGTNFFGADLEDAKLAGTDLDGVNFSEANLKGANLAEANLLRSTFVDTDLTNADLTRCRVFGISAWNLKLEGTKQRDLVITGPGEPAVTVDDIEVAQFIYLLLHNDKIRRVIDTITSKVVLILGRFTPERKLILDALRDDLRGRGLLPVLFDFLIPASRDVTETVKVLAGLARFVIADITDATEVRVELHNIIRDFPSLPVQPIVLRGQPEFISMSHLKKFPWLLRPFEYESEEHLIANLDQNIVGPTEEKVLNLRGTRK